MERIGVLINQLKQQFDENAGVAQMQHTIQLLQQEILHHEKRSSKVSGSSKVSVLMPSMSLANVFEDLAAPQLAIVEQESNFLSTIALKMATNVVEKQEPKQQLNNQFDFIHELPTFSQQAREVNDVAIKNESLNDKLRLEKPELAEALKETPVKDLKRAVGINDRFLFINDLFRGDEAMYERSVKTINNFNIYPEAEYWINRELKVKLGWDNGNRTVVLFDQLIKRRFS